MPPCSPAPGADVDDVVGDLHRVFVVFDDENRVAEVAHAHEGLDQALVVALVQPDRRFVEHVQHTDETRTDLRCQADPLGLPAGQGGRVARHRQVVEADVEQEAEPGVDLLQHLFGDDGVAFAQLQLAEGLGRIGDRHRTQVVDRVTVDGDRQRERVEPGLHHRCGTAPGACSPRSARGWRRTRPPVAPHEVRDHALVPGLIGAGAAVPVLVADLDPPLHRPCRGGGDRGASWRASPRATSWGMLVDPRRSTRPGGRSSGCVPRPTAGSPHRRSSAPGRGSRGGIDLEHGAETRRSAVHAP